MPPPVRRFVRVLFCVALLALVVVAAAVAGNGGLAPPSPASPNAKNIRDIYWLILAITGGIFVLVTGTLLVFLVRYRSKGRPREIEGQQVRGHTKLELAWTAGPVILLAIIAGFVFWKVSDIGATSGVPASERSAPRDEITIQGHQYYWEFVYANGAISIDHLRLPYNRPVRLTIVSADVNHSWWVPALNGKLDAIPGKTNHMTFRPTKLGTFPGQCAEFCGLLHAQMRAQAEVLHADQFDAWVDQRKGDEAALGKETFVGVCAKCHGLAAQGEIGPTIAQSALLKDPKALAGVIRNGTGKMPAVGHDWPQNQVDATIAYLQKRFAQGGGSTGGQG
jgi:cytochrome c oxidase subunit II